MIISVSDFRKVDFNWSAMQYIVFGDQKSCALPINRISAFCWIVYMKGWSTLNCLTLGFVRFLRTAPTKRTLQKIKSLHQLCSVGVGVCNVHFYFICNSKSFYELIRKPNKRSHKIKVPNGRIIHLSDLDSFFFFASIILIF